MGDFTPLRLAGGTLRIKLSADSASDLILDRDTVKAHCTTLEPLLRTTHEHNYQAAWDRSALVKVKDDEGAVRVYSLGLKTVEDTLMLEGHVW
jgi:hypothetical protein